MIPLNLIQSTAETLMDKAAIEIPEDYLDGLKRAAADLAIRFNLPKRDLYQRGLALKDSEE